MEKVQGNWGAVFTSAMIEQGISQYRMSKDLLIPLSSIQNYCNGVTEPSISRFCLIANYLKITL